MRMPIKILRAILIGILLVVIGIPLTAYIMLSTDWAQQRMADTAREALLLVLGTETYLDDVEYAPFNRLKIKGVAILDNYGEPCLAIDEIQVRMELAELILHQKFIIDYVVIDGLDIRIFKDTPDAPLNISGIIERFKKDDAPKEPKQFLLRLNDLEIINSRVSYNVVSADTLYPRFDPNHIYVSGISMGLHAPKLSESGLRVQISRLSATEHSGLAVTNLTANVEASDTTLCVDNLAIEMPQSRLEFGPVTAALPSFPDIAKIGTSIPVSAEIATGSYVYLPALAPLVPILEKADLTADVSLLASGTLGNINLQSVKLGCDVLTVTASGNATGFPVADSLMFRGVKATANADCSKATALLKALGVKNAPALDKFLAGAGMVNVRAAYDGSLSKGRAMAKVATSSGAVDASASFSKAGTSVRYKAKAEFDALNPGRLMQIADVGPVSGVFESEGSVSRGKFNGTVTGNIAGLEYKEYNYRDISFDASSSAGETKISVEAADPNLDFSLIASLVQSAEVPDRYAAGIDIRRANLCALNLTGGKLDGYNLSAEVSAKVSAISLAQFEGNVEVSNLHYVDSMFTGLRMKSFEVDADCLQPFQEICVASDYVNGKLQGRFNLATLESAVKRIAAQALPQLVYGSDYAKETAEGDAVEEEDDAYAPEYDNDFVFNFTIDNAENPCSFFSLPIAILDPVTITGYLSDRSNSMLLNLDAEWLMQGLSLIHI